MSVQELLVTQELTPALDAIAAQAGELDRRPRFPVESFAALAGTGVLSEAPLGLVREARLVRAVAAADGSTARILDGHLNGVERLTLTGPEPLARAELERIRAGELLLGVWGADPVAGEGPPARLEREGERLVLRGVKIFCSGAGGVDRALVVVADADGARRVAYVDTGAGIEIDRGWYRASGLRASESHRVEFQGTPVLTLLGGPRELSREPFFSRDAIRTSATWAGLADAILAEAVAVLDPARLDRAGAHELGRMRIARGTIDRWLEHATASLDCPERPLGEPDPAALALECRAALSDCARSISERAARLCGSRALIGDSALDRARRDLDLFLLQHRLDPKIADLGAQTLAPEGP